MSYLRKGNKEILKSLGKSFNSFNEKKWKTKKEFLLLIPPLISDGHFRFILEELRSNEQICQCVFERYKKESALNWAKSALKLDPSCLHILKPKKDERITDCNSQNY